jgi:hypothetical protein
MYREVHTQEEIGVALNAARAGLMWQLITLLTFATIVSRFLFVSSCWTGQVLAYTPRQGANWRVLSWAVFVSTLAIMVCPLQPLQAIDGV